MYLEGLESKSFFPRAAGYIAKTGPGLLQSAMTLGAGSAAASIVAGAYYGYSLLWVQPVAMFLGIMMLGALSNVILTTGERPYKAFGRELHISIAFLWALGTVVASIIWHFPQYGLAAGAARDLYELANGPGTATGDGMFGFSSGGLAASIGVGVLILAINIFTTWNYGKGGRGIKLYEWFLRTTIAVVVIAFGIVVVAKFGSIAWDRLAQGFFGFQLDWSNPACVTTVLGAIGAAVGINMTFLYPYSLLAKGWGPKHKKLSRWDLGMSMFLPFVLVTSLVIIAMAITVNDNNVKAKQIAAPAAELEAKDPAAYEKALAKFEEEKANAVTIDGKLYVAENDEGKQILLTMAKVEAADKAGETVSEEDRKTADTLILPPKTSDFKPIQAAQSLTSVMGDTMGRLVFDLGFIAMTLGAISTHMVVCGFTFCEMFGMKQSVWTFRLFALTPAIGILGVVLPSPMWMPIMASAICLTMLPIAYIAFFIMNNKKSYIGEATGHGIGRVIFNVILLIAIAMCTIGAAIKLKGGVVDKIWPTKPAAEAPADPAEPVAPAAPEEDAE